MAPNPVSLHGYIVLVGFLPMYLAGRSTCNTINICSQHW